MIVTVSGDCHEDRRKIRELIEEYGRTEGKQIKVEEYPAGAGLKRAASARAGEADGRMVFPFVEGSVELDLQKIIYVETDRHKNIFHTEDGDYRLYRKLDEIEAELAPFGFLRVHKSFLVNMRYVERISSYLLRLATGKEISVPKSRYPYVKREYAVYKGE